MQRREHEDSPWIAHNLNEDMNLDETQCKGSGIKGGGVAAFWKVGH